MQYWGIPCGFYFLLFCLNDCPQRACIVWQAKKKKKAKQKYTEKLNKPS